MSINHLEVIMKVSERCNLNCKYCYFFHGGDTSYKKKPPLISDDTVMKFIDFITVACRQYPIKTLQVDLHGGEPLLQKKSRFVWMCEKIIQELSSIVDVSFTIQTNGVLIDDEWIDIFSRFKVSVGVSLDGTKEANDMYRIDHQGRGSYNKVIIGLQKLMVAKELNKIDFVGVLSVINPAFTAKETFGHLIRDLKVENIDFLLPDYSYESFPEKESALSYLEFLSEIFDLWMQHNKPNVNIRILKSIIKLMLGGNTDLLGLGPQYNNYAAITISSNGDLLPDDTLRPIFTELDENIYNIESTTLKEFLESTKMNNIINDGLKIIPTKCTKCEWVGICNGGSLLIHRYKDKTFDNPSVYCDGLKMLYSKINNFLLSNGYMKSKAA